MQIHLFRKKVILFVFIHLLCVSIYSNDIHAKDIGYKSTYAISNKIVEENIIKDREKSWNS